MVDEIFQDPVLNGKNLLVTGATGMIGSYMIDRLMERSDVRVIAVGRSRERLAARFGRHGERVRFATSPQELGDLPADGRPDFVIHLASNTHPRAYAEDPIGTIECNVMMTRDWLEFAATCPNCRFVFASSVEIYGQNRGDVEFFDEAYCGYLDSNTLRAGYPESKRCGEALCQAYLRQKGVDFVIPRLPRVYGPTLLKTDTKALSQFLGNALRGEDIVLKSEGGQHFSYLHVHDAVTGLLTVMLKGETGEAYNLADPSGDIRLRDLAALVAAQAGRKVIFDLPDSTERAGFSTATTARLDPSKARSLGWKAAYTIETGIADTFEGMKS